MAFSVSSAKLTGSPGTSGWVQVHEFAPTEPEKLASRGRLFAVVATGRHEEGVDAVAAGRELLSRLHEEYFGSGGGSAFAILEAAVKKVSQEFRSTWGEVEIAAVSLVEGVVYSVVGGGAQVAIFRNGILAKILESTREEVISASGYPKEGDVLILGTKFFFEVFSSGVIKAAIEGKEPASAVESLAPTVHSRDDTGSLGAAILSFKEAEGVIAEVAPPPAPGEKVARISSSFAKAASFVQGYMARFFPERKIYVKGMGEEEEEVPQKRKLLSSVGIILLVLLVVSIGFGIRAKAVKEGRARYESRLTQARHEFDEALTLVSLNPDRARELFVNSRALVETLKAEGVKDRGLEELIVKLDENQGAVLGEYQAEPQLFVDLSILSDNLRGDGLAASSEMVFVLDKGGRKVVGIRFGTKKSEIVAGPDQISAAKDLAVYEDRAFVLEADGIYEVGKTKTKVVDNKWQAEVLIYAYAANLYVVDKEAGVIWRYPGSGSTFGAGTNWLAPGVSPDLSLVKATTIDGAIWFLSASGRISKFSQGNSINLTIAGVFPQLANPDSIYTNEELDFVYILERDKKRVVVLEKDGKYKAQYIADKLGEATDLAVSEADGKIIILTGDKLFSIETKHL
ncbi:MAG: hypothetical protein UX80_C0015G0026 [Candidatus Amesbacteria bacterium GW2011_GWA2_47_11b]|uniref:PPM-type phosphatase domain-containing protein n=1 Tax=Candidatus Amesbacteria bacterium GW2011_GWA2_47_11b TaxID=1618358 RepID=A0A0G1RK80_9BACT|nr:MAG: hypothetical protein UX80_C0015G0026 [Candidatus Amesbacteria bacterium GW2011_GWA2_47_11b]